MTPVHHASPRAVTMDPASLGERLYCATLRLLPARFRAEAGPEMLAVFRDWRAAARDRRFGDLRVWWLALRDLAACIRTERLRSSPALPRIQDQAPMIEILFKDCRYALRGLRRAPGFTAIVVLTLALGIGANTAIFSVVDGILLRALPFEDPDELVAVWADTTRRGGPLREWLSYPNFHDVRQLDDVFAEVGAYLGWGATLTGTGDAVSLGGLRVSEGMFNRVLGVQPALGRGFAAGDDLPDAERVVLLSWSLWQQQWQGDPSILGKSIALSGEPTVVIGVMPATFQPPFRPQAQMWTTLRMDASQHAGSRGEAMYHAIGRLQPGVALAAAQSASNTLGSTLEQEYPSANLGMGYTLRPLRSDIVDGTSSTLWVLLGAVGFVLLMACVNVANLLLAQATSRVGEIALRSAVGASRAAITRQLLAESVVLATTGGALGALLGVFATRALIRLAPPGTPRLAEVTVDARVLAFTATVTLLAAFAFGLIPALRASRGDLAAALSEVGRNADGSSGRRLRAGLVVVQVALAMVLLVGAGLLLRTFQQMNTVDLGFEPGGVLAMQLGLPSSRYADQADRVAFYGELERRLATLPGVDAVGGVDTLPLGGSDGDAHFQIEGRQEPARDQERIAWIRRMTPGYPETIGLRLVSGRFFEASDDVEATRAAVINQTLASTYFEGQEPVGQRLYFGRADNEPLYLTIVGVVGDIKNFGVTQESRNAIYLAYGQMPTGFMSMVLRTSGDPLSLAAPARAVVADLDHLLAAANISTVDDVVRQSLASERFTTILMSAFAAVALTLAAIGLYGVVSYAVNMRSHEIGVRMALGADRQNVGRLVIGGSVGLVGAGVVLGTVGAWGATRVLAGLLYETEPTDPLTFLTVMAVLLLSGVIAATLPANRASRIDPVHVLSRS